MTGIGALLEAARRTKKHSKYAVEKETGVPHSVLKRVESGTGFLSVGTLSTLCEFYGLDIKGAVAVLESDRMKRQMDRHADRTKKMVAA